MHVHLASKFSVVVFAPPFERIFIVVWKSPFIGARSSGGKRKYSLATSGLLFQVKEDSTVCAVVVWGISAPNIVDSTFIRPSSKRASVSNRYLARLYEQLDPPSGLLV